MTGSKVSKRFPATKVSGQAVGFGGGTLFLIVRVFSVKKSEKTFGRSSESNVEGRGEEMFF